MAGRDYTLHPNYDRLAERLEKSELQGELDECMAAR